MSTSQKEKNFSTSPLREHGEWKAVTTLGGIGDKAGAALTKVGYSKAFHVVGQYLVSNMEEEIFKAWLADIMEKDSVSLSAHHMDSCFNSVKAWCDNNM